MPTKYTVRFIETDEDGHVEGKKKATFLADNDMDAFAKVLSKAYGISKEEFVADYLEGYDSESEDFVIGVNYRETEDFTASSFNEVNLLKSELLPI